MSKGGKMPGAGRPQGAKSKKTIEKNIVEEEFKQRVMKSMDEIINSQMNLARGCQMLFYIHTYEDKKGNTIRERPKLVTDQDTIEQYLAGELTDDEGNRNEDDNDYYFITTDKPDNKALDSLIDRVFGKPTQNIKAEGNIILTIQYDKSFEIARQARVNSKQSGKV